MDTELDLWRLAAGLGLFLFGMHQLEQALTLLAGRPFKKFLKNYTAKPLRSVVAGAVSTAALQSSSVVSMIVLAFVGTGLISLASAIGIVFGSNVGTTATGWIVATVGFKFDIEALALPLIAIGGLGYVWSTAGTKRAGVSYLIVGIGLMLLGLQFMKSGALVATGFLDPEELAGYTPFVFLLAGLIVTAIIQSSSATIVITLSALFAGAIPLVSSAAITIGADLGTTITVVLGALAGSTEKKRVATALVVFNIIKNGVAFIFLGPLLELVTGVFGIVDPLFALVAFHTTFNVIGVVLFLPAIGFLSRRLEHLFTGEEAPLLRHVKPIDSAVPEAAIENIVRETYRLIDQSIALNLAAFGLPPDYRFYDCGDDRQGVSVFATGANYDRCYADLKQLEGEILANALELQRAQLEPAESAKLSQLIPSIRNAVHAAKSIKDIYDDLRTFRDSVSDRFHAYFDQFREAEREFYEVLDTLNSAGIETLRFEALVELKNKGEAVHRRMHRRIYDEVARGELTRLEISTLLNVNRELYISNQSLLSALVDALLGIDAARDFETIPAAG